MGLRDPRLTRNETDQIAQAVRSRGALTYLVFPDEGRDLVRPGGVLFDLDRALPQFQGWTRPVRIS